jgi:hypothetical protein
MRRNESKLASAASWRLFLFAALLVGLPFFAACGGDDESEVPSQQVEIRLTENAIEMPATVAPGPVELQVVNETDTPRKLGIEGPIGSEELEQVQPGQRASLELVLDPGTYRVYSPGDSREVQTALRVGEG